MKPADRAWRPADSKHKDATRGPAEYANSYTPREMGAPTPNMSTWTRDTSPITRLANQEALRAPPASAATATFGPASWPLGTPADDVPPPETSREELSFADTMRNQQLLFQVNPRSSIVTRTLEAASLRPTARGDFNVLWQKKFLNPFQMRQLHPQQRVNHFPGMNLLTYKHELVKTIREHSARAVKAGKPEAAVDKFLPQTWLLPDEFPQLEKDWEEGRVLILKHAISARGEGIQLTDDLAAVKKASWQAKEDEVTLVASVYVPKPYLVPAGGEGKKFDLRLYVCITSVDPLRAYWHKEGLARFASEPYALTADNLEAREVHLTNYTVNKNAPEPEPEPEPEPDLTRPTGQARVKPSAEESHAQREARLAALAEKHQKDLEDGNAFTVPRSPPKQPPKEEPAGPAEPPENLSTNLKWELSELEKHLTSERGVSAEALEGVWEQVGLLIRGTLRALAPKIRPQVILPPAPAASSEGPRSRVLVLVPPFLGPGFRLGARWNRLGEAVKTRKKREKTGGKWARYGLKRVNKEGTGGIT